MKGGGDLLSIVIQALILGCQWRVREESVFEERVGEDRVSGGHCKNSPGITFVKKKYITLLKSFVILIANLYFYSITLITLYIHIYINIYIKNLVNLVVGSLYIIL